MATDNFMSTGAKPVLLVASSGAGGWSAPGGLKRHGHGYLQGRVQSGHDVTASFAGGNVACGHGRGAAPIQAANGLAFGGGGHGLVAAKV